MIRNILRLYWLKRHRSKVKTKITAIKNIHSALVLLDVRDKSFSACKEEVLAYFQKNNVICDFLYFDFRDSDRFSHNQNEIKTSEGKTIFKKDLNLFGKPRKEKIARLIRSNKEELFISLINEDYFPLEFFANKSCALFKIGRKQLKRNIFDMVISDNDECKYSALESFKAIKDFFSKII